MTTLRNGVQQRSVRLQRPHDPATRYLRARETASKPDPELTRRHFLAGAGAAAAVSAGALFAPARAEAQSGGSCRPAAPRPIPGEDPDLAGLGLHVFLPVPGREPSTIFDFHGRVAILDLIGDCVDENDNPLAFRADLRFMEGSYVGLDGQRHDNAFGFV